MSFTIRKLKTYDLEIDPDTCIKNLSAEIKDGITSPTPQKDQVSLGYLFLKTCHLFYQIDHWNQIGSEFFHFRMARQKSFDNIEMLFKKLNRNARRYYQLKAELASEARPCPLDSQGDARSRVDQMYPKILTELRKDLKRDLNSILDQIYLFIACAVHNKKLVAKEREKSEQTAALEFTAENRLNLESVDSDDWTILAFFLVFLTALAAIIASFVGSSNLGQTSSITYVVWSAMALFVGMASGVIAVAVKQARETSAIPFWNWICPQNGRPWCSYLLSTTGQKSHEHVSAGD